MMKMENISNAFTRVETGNVVLLCDPWTSKGIFHGGWSPFPPILDTEAPFKGVTHCFISHIHEDHCDYPAIEKLGRDTVMLVPEIFPNHVIHNELGKRGFTDIRMIPLSKNTEIESGIMIEVVPPMNSWGTEVRRYEEDGLGPAAIDTGQIFDDGETKIVLLADNSPYNISDAGL